METEFLKAILGDLTIVNYVVGFFFVMLALIFKWSVKTYKGVKHNPKTPHKFSWTYWLENNIEPKLKAVISTIIVVYLTFRFAENIVGTAFTYAIAISVGLSIDAIIAKIKKLSIK